jgi:hypothetical protein
MSWDAGAVSNFGALNFPSSNGSGGGAIPNNLVVSTLTASVDISGLNANLHFINLQGEPLQYACAGFASTSTTGPVTVNLPITYRDISYSVIVNYADVGARISALDTYGLMGLPNTTSSFDLICQNTAASYVVQYITCGILLPR